MTITISNLRDDAAPTETTAAKLTATDEGGSITPCNSGSAHPTCIAFSPTKASLPDNAPAGSPVAAVSVSMSDGSAFSGTPCRDSCWDGDDVRQTAGAGAWSDPDG
jgi:hypothetical protein